MYEYDKRELESRLEEKIEKEFAGRLEEKMEKEMQKFIFFKQKDDFDNQRQDRDSTKTSEKGWTVR